MIRAACQICLMTSPDGRRWQRHVDAAGREYITSNHDLQAGTPVCRLVWDQA